MKGSLNVGNIPVCKTPDLSTAVHRVGNSDHYHENCEFLLEVSGEITSTVNGVSDRLAAGDIVFINSSSLHSLTELSADHEHRDIYISNARLRGICISLFDADFYDHLTSKGALVKIKTDGGEFSSVISRLIDLELAASLAVSEKDLETNRRCMLAVIVQLLGVYYEQINSENSVTPHWLVEFLRTIQTPDVFSRSVDEIISMSGYSHTHFCAIFKKYFSKSFKTYINELRVAYARSMLVSTDSSVLDISLTVGYSSLSHFIQCFKKSTGITPGQYRAANM